MSVCNSVHKSEHGDDYIEDPDPVTLISKLDISDPLHLHPNDSTALTVISIKLKGTENYQVWSCAMLLALQGKNRLVLLMDHVKDLTQMKFLVDNGIGAKYVWEELKETYDKIDGSKYPHWADAMNQEMDALLINGTWEIVDLPKDRKAIGSKWIYKIKFRSISDIDRHKARLVAQGFGQKEGIDYEETFFPVVKMVTVRCLLNTAVSKSWHVFQLDVNNAFLYGDLVETVYMKPPEGYFSSGNKVRRLKKSLYGLKQAPRQWNAKLTSTLTENDDIIITGNNIYEIEKFKAYLKSKFMIKDLGKLKYFFGIEVIDTNKGICLNQRKYVLDLLSEYGMLACKPAKTPLMSKLVISNEASDIDPILDNITDYQKLIGLGIHIINDSSMNLKAFSDADWPKLKKQNTLSKYSTEAEYRAHASVISEVIWNLKILKDLNIENLLPVSFHCDSNSAIKIAAKPVFH
ncbi:ribonuclease H-like domain-containing protein [Tanacetum coccineum]